jgi:probable HAF family extracellular repeat protein
MNRLRIVGFVATCLWLASIASADGATPSFMGLGFLPTSNSPTSRASDISNDGTIVVGTSTSTPAGTNNEAFRWTSSTGLVGLGDLPGSDFSSSGQGISGDGVTLVGSSLSTGNVFEAYRWTQGTGMLGLGVPVGAIFTNASDASNDGSVIVGSIGVTPTQNQAYRWTQATGMVPLGQLSVDFPGSTAEAVSANGATVVGTSQGNNVRAAFRWTQGTGMIALSGLPGAVTTSDAFDVSADGTVVVGDYVLAGIFHAFRWTQLTGAVDLGPIVGGGTAITASAKAMSPDGAFIVGTGSGSGGNSFLWDAANGARRLTDVFNSLGLQSSYAGWLALTPTGIAADGKTIVGFGTNPQGNVEGWIASVPEPSSMILLGFGSIALLGRAARRPRT